MHIQVSEEEKRSPDWESCDAFDRGDDADGSSDGAISRAKPEPR